MTSEPTTEEIVGMLTRRGAFSYVSLDELTVIRLAAQRLSNLEGERVDLEGKLGEAETNAEGWHRAVEVILTVYGLSPALGASEACEAMRDLLTASESKLGEATAVVLALFDQWPDNSAPSGPLCVRASNVINASEALKLTASGGGEGSSLSSAAEHSGSSTPRTSAPHSAGKEA